MEPIKIALLSCNHGHARGYYGLKDDPRFDLRAISIAPGYHDRIFIERLEGIDQYDDDEKMLDAHPEIEAVVMCSSNWYHPKQFKLCLERNLHILSMKVPTLDLEEYDKILELKKKSKSIVTVELEMHYHAETYRLKELIHNGKIGKVTSFMAANSSHNPMWWLPWHGLPEESYGKRVPIKPGSKIYRGGCLTDHPHIFDMMRWMLDDEVAEVYAETAPNARKAEVEDFVFVTGVTKKGTTFSLDPSYSRMENPAKIIDEGWERYPKRVEVNMSAFGTDGYVIGDVYGNWMHHTGLPHHNYVSFGSGHRFGFGGRIDDFVNAVRYGKEPTVTLEHHKKTIEIIDAAYRSIYEGKPIKLNN